MEKKITFAEAKEYRLCWTYSNGEDTDGVWFPIDSLSEKLINEDVKFLSEHTSSVFRVEYR
jgi:hypothetical protein